MYSLHQTSHESYIGTCKRESDVSEGIQALSVTFELMFPTDMNTDEVIRLIEVLQSDLNGFVEMLLDAAIHEV